MSLRTAKMGGRRSISRQIRSRNVVNQHRKMKPMTVITSCAVSPAPWRHMGRLWMTPAMATKKATKNCQKTMS